jgi:hypothetical protein
MRRRFRAENTHDVVELAMKGYGDAEIAEMTNLSLKTVRNYRLDGGVVYPNRHRPGSTRKIHVSASRRGMAVNITSEGLLLGWKRGDSVKAEVNGDRIVITKVER